MFYLLATALFSLLVAVFAVQNTLLVSVQLGFWQIEASLAMIVIGAAAVGIMAALPIWLMLQVQLRYRLMRANSRVSELESELGKHRNAGYIERERPNSVLAT